LRFSLVHTGYWVSKDILKESWFSRFDASS
jgi:hypothetical protein